jgi:hypothetical protein
MHGGQILDALREWTTAGRGLLFGGAAEEGATETGASNARRTVGKTPGANGFVMGSLSSLQGFTFFDGFFTSGRPPHRYHIENGTVLNRRSVLVCELVFLVCPPLLLAQRGGRGAGAGRPVTGASSPAPNSDSDFARAVALQATPDQVAKFPQLTESTEAARKEAQNLIQLAENANKPDSSRGGDLNDRVDEARSNNRQFVQSFSASQQSGLKPLVKKLSKADSDVSKLSEALRQGLERAETDGRKIANVVEKLDRALTTFQTVQLSIGKEMGIHFQEHSR